MFYILPVLPFPIRGASQLAKAPWCTGGSTPHQPPHHSHPKGDVDSHHASRDSGQTCCHHSMYLGDRQLANVWTDQEKGVRLGVGEKREGQLYFSMIKTHHE